MYCSGCQGLCWSSIVVLMALGGCATTQTETASSDSRSTPIALPTRNAEPSPTNEVRQVAHIKAANPAHNDRLFEGPTHVEELISFAMSNNPEIRVARAKAQARMARIPQARALDDPYVSTTLFIKEIETAAGPQEAVVSVSQKLPWFGKRWLRGHAAYHDAQAAYAELANVELTVIEQVKLAYYDLYFIEEAIRVNRLLVPKLNDVISMSRSKYETDEDQVGLETVLQAEVELHQLQVTLAELGQARAKANARLAKAIHLPRGLKLAVQPRMPETSRPPDVDMLVAMIDQCHPQLKARRQEIQRDNTNVRLARKNYFPDFNIGFNWIDIGERGLSPVANGDDAYSVMLGMNVPIYRGKLNAAVRETRANASQSSHRYNATWDQLRADVETFHAQAIEHDRVLAILNTKILRKAEQTLELSVEGYRVDRIGFQQLIDNYETLLRFRISYHMRRARREQAIAQLERAIGCVASTWQVASTVRAEPLPEPQN